MAIHDPSIVHFYMAKGACKNCKALVWWVHRQCPNCKTEYPTSRALFYWPGMIVFGLAVIMIPLFICMALGII
jgi:RNA polymerase subunit RPABC4/transcription elongation factor Spt4